MIFPPPLKSGDTVGIVASARKISEKELTPAVRTFHQWGLNVELGKNLFRQDHQYAGSDEERAADFQGMLDDPRISAIICARGGYGTVRIIDRLKFNKFIKNPKWIAGFSDITVFHSHINQNLGIATLHAMMPLNIVRGKKMLPRAQALESFRRVLFGENLKYQVPPHPLNRKGKATGILTGGNLSVLYSLNGSVSEIDTSEKILFIEDLDEYLYHIDRMMVNLKRAGKLDRIAGLVIGGMTEMKDNKVPFGKTAEEIIRDTVKDIRVPVCFGFPAGHIDDNRAMILGSEVNLNVGENGVTLSFL